MEQRAARQEEAEKEQEAPPIPPPRENQEERELKLSSRVVSLLFGGDKSTPAQTFEKWVSLVRKRSGTFRPSGFPRRSSRIEEMPSGSFSLFSSADFSEQVVKAEPANREKNPAFDHPPEISVWERLGNASALDIESSDFSWNMLSSLHHTEHSNSSEHSEDEMTKALEMTVNSGGVVFFALFNSLSNNGLPKEEAAVIKFATSKMATQAELLGFEFARLLGVQTPQARVVHNSSLEWQEIIHAAENARAIAVSNNDEVGEMTCSELLEALELSRCLLLMSYIHGSPLLESSKAFSSRQVACATSSSLGRVLKMVTFVKVKNIILHTEQCLLVVRSCIYILLYKEVSLALKINSMYSKRRLLNIHENVKVLRYPDHFSTGIYLWSHHEKIVIVDNQVCYIGGLDLCFGRYDTPEHKVVDCPPSVWPGKDYYNPRESEPNSWEDTMKDELDRTKYPRMPWHDVQCALYGPACRDVARHFVQRWNYAKRNKAPNEQAIPLLMPHHHMVIPHYMGNSKDTNCDTESKQTQDKDIKVRRLSTLTAPASCQDIPLLLPQEPDHLALRNGDLGLDLDINHGHLDHPNQTNFKQPLSNRKAKQDLCPQDLQMKGFVDNLGSPEVSLVMHHNTSKENVHHMDKEWWETQERGNQVASVLDVGEVGPQATCRCQIIRSVGPWSAGTTQIEGSIHNAYFSLIEKAEHFVYIENQFFISGLSGDDTIKNRVLEALYRRILRAEKEKKCFRVIIVIPLLPGFQGGIDDGGAASVRAIMHWQYRTICRGPNSILENLYDVVGSKAHDYISFYGLRAHGRLGDGGPLVTNQIYVHSKLMIIDDRMTLIGSANINDRSLLGSRDSEIGMIIEDKEVASSTMDGSHWEAGKFSFSLRLSLWAEHLGLRGGEVSQIMDPVADSTYKNIWMATAKANTAIYQDVFLCVPNDHIHSRAQFRQSFAHRKEKIGHTTIDLGVALEKAEILQEDGDMVVVGTDPTGRLQAVRGNLVSFPLEFMCQEDLRPFFSESEYYTSPQVFH